MNPLSPWTTCRRHKRRTLLLVGLIGLAALSVCVMVRLLDALVEQTEVSERYLARLSVVSASGPSLELGVLARIQAHPGVAQVVPEKSLYIDVPAIGALPAGFRLFGVSEADAQAVIDACGLRLKEGRMLRARTNEAMLSQELADTLGLRIGDLIGRSVDERAYGGIPTTLVLVGVLESDPSLTLRIGPSTALRTGPLLADETGASREGVRLGLLSYEYMEGHELYASQPSSLIVIPEWSHKAEVDRFLETEIASSRTHVWTYRRLSESMAEGLSFLHLVFGVVDCLVAAVIALVVGTIHQIGLGQRTEELGLLHATGYGKNWLIGRLIVEAATIAAVGWFAGLAFSWLLFAWLKARVLTPSMELDLANLTPVWFAAPIPLAVIAFVAFSVARIFARFDAVAIIERGKLSVEAGDQRRAVKRSSARPLSSRTFYLRHRRRSLALAMTIALMIVGVAFPVFLMSPMIDANMLFSERLRYVSVVSPRAGPTVDPGVAAQVRVHPAVARVVPAVELGLLMDVPPFNRNYTWIYGVSEDDLQALVDVYGVQVEQGRLPRPRSNEIVVSRAVAMNRDLQVGDKVGEPAYAFDHDIPTEMAVVGILSGPLGDHRRDDIWSGFASYEYLRSHERYASRPVSLLVVPREGHMGELNRWLEENVASEGTSVRTYERQLRRHRQDMRTLILLLGAIESLIAVVAALALAILSYTFVAQRREEFGILYAMGRSRSWLVRRTVREAASVVTAAWLIGAAVCMAGLAYVQVALYAPKGLALDWGNPAPWLFTLPMPLAVVAAGAGLVAWMLSRLDPVAVIERRG
jgi:ABC-type lipoprotein release transport system permease subunit